MNTIGSLPPVSYVAPRIVRIDGGLVGTSVATSFPSLLKAQSDPRPSPPDVAISRSQPESVMSMARRPNVEAMLQQLIAYGKKHLCIDKTEQSTHDASVTSSFIVGCGIADDSLDDQLLNSVCPDHHSIDLCIKHLHDANAWLADYSGNGPANIIPDPSAALPLPGLFVWVWIPIEQTRTPQYARPRRLPRIPGVGGVRFVSIVDSGIDES